MIERNCIVKFMCVFQVVSALAVFRASWLFANEAGEVPKNPDAGIIRVAVLESAGTSPSALKLIDALHSAGPDQTQISRITPEQIRDGRLAEVDVLVCPGGSGSKQARTLEEKGCAAVVKFVREGGGYLGVCAGAYLATSHYSWSLGLIDAKVVDTKHWARGKDNVQVKLSPDAVKLFETVDDEITLYYAQGPLLARNNVDDPGIPDLECLGTFATEVAKKGAPRGVMIGCSAIIRCGYGQGRVFCFSPHPELTPGQGHLLIKAVHWLCNH